MLYTDGKFIRGKPHVVFMDYVSYLSMDAFTGNYFVVIVVLEDANVFPGKIDRLVQLDRKSVV